MIGPHEPFGLADLRRVVAARVRVAASVAVPIVVHDGVGVAIGLTGAADGDTRCEDHTCHVRIIWGARVEMRYH